MIAIYDFDEFGGYSWIRLKTFLYWKELAFSFFRRIKREEKYDTFNF